ncbi:MAG: VOC family protein [Oscillospiraceae bacterium]|jgi:lactoylglutathione lyase|nr:VOC family protein [Oscillospiraceae bacterium]
MQFTFKHTNINVLDIEKSLAFYEEALGLTVQRRFSTPDFTIAFLGDGASAHELEVTCLHGRCEPYDLEDNEIHIAFGVADMEAAKKKHKEMGCVAYENHDMGIYFIEDPDGYWMEIVPE